MSVLRVSFGISGMKGFSRERFQELLEIEGFEAHAPRQRTPAEAFSSLVNRLQGIYHREVSYSVGVDRTLENAKIIEFVIKSGIVDTSQGEAINRATDGLKVARIIFNKETGDINSFFAGAVWWGEDMSEDLKTCPPFLRDEIEAIPGKLLAETTLVSTGQVRGTILRILGTAGIPASGIQAAWNLPLEREPLAESLQAIAEAINTEIGEEAVRVDIATITNKRTVETVQTDALVFAKRELEAMLLKEQEKIEASQDPEAAHQQAMAKFSIEADKVMNVIRQHKGFLGEKFQEIEDLQLDFEALLRDFEIPLKSKEPLLAS